VLFGWSEKRREVRLFEVRKMLMAKVYGFYGATGMFRDELFDDGIRQLDAVGVPTPGTRYNV